MSPSDKIYGDWFKMQTELIGEEYWIYPRVRYAEMFGEWLLHNHGRLFYAEYSIFTDKPPVYRMIKSGKSVTMSELRKIFDKTDV